MRFEKPDRAAERAILLFVLLPMQCALRAAEPSGPSLAYAATMIVTTLGLMCLYLSAYVIPIAARPGAAAVILGTVTNKVTILVNGGAMPFVHPTLVGRSYWTPATGREPLLFLADVLWRSDGAAYSIGDVLILAGTCAIFVGAAVSAIIGKRATPTSS